jgi:ribosomal protein S24E
MPDPQPTPDQIREIEINFINRIYHHNDPTATHKEVLNELADYFNSQKSNSQTDTAPPC